jgi:NAD kinase
MAGIDKIVVVMQPTQLDELVQRFATREQARFYIEHMGGQFAAYEDAHAAYQDARETLRAALPKGVRVQWIDRSFLPTFLFGPEDLVVTLGRDGLVVNTAKYLAGQPVLALNPDPARIDGVLLPFTVAEAPAAFAAIKSDACGRRSLVMAKAELNDGQSLHAVNDLFVGAKSHVSARYRLKFNDVEEDQSSSGIIISTGTGSTGWYRSILTGAAAIVEMHAPGRGALAVRDQYAFDGELEHLVFTIREPFISKTSGADLAFGLITPEDPLEVISHMPRNGVLFGDGVEEDFLQFNSGTTARISPSEKRLNLLVPSASRR